MTNYFYQENMGREDDYDQSQSLFSSLVEDIPHHNIQEVWKVTICKILVTRAIFKA